MSSADQMRRACRMSVGEIVEAKEDESLPEEEEESEEDEESEPDPVPDEDLELRSAAGALRGPRPDDIGRGMQLDGGGLVGWSVGGSSDLPARPGKGREEGFWGGAQKVGGCPRGVPKNVWGAPQK